MQKVKRLFGAWNYPSLVAKLFSFPGRGSKTFEAACKLDRLLGMPHRAFRSVHVAGTNGKGSVALKIAKGLQLEGYRVGLYTSPHISSVRERIRIDGEMISEEAMLQYLPPLFDCIADDLSFFDLLTSLAFVFFRASSIDWAVIETGLGGRFDATNVIDAELSVITSIGYDHMAILGSTLDAIAKEKGGIVRSGVPLLVGPTAVPFFPSADAVQGAFDFYDQENSALARAALLRLGVSEASIAAGVLARPWCRFEQIGDTILDVAHNPDGFRKLIRALEVHFPNEKFHFIAGFSKDKQWRECIDLMRPLAESIHLLHAHPRLIDFGEGSSWAEAMALKDSRKVVCGSFYLMSQARRHLGILDFCDPEECGGFGSPIDPAMMADAPCIAR